MVWNTNKTDSQQAIVSGVQSYAAGNGDQIHAYVARPDGAGPYPGIVLVHHLPGWDELYQEFARRFANHGYTVIAPDLYCRNGHGTPDEVAGKVRAEGGVADSQVAADCEAAMNWLRAQPTSNGKVGIIGTCSGGRHTVMVASKVKGFDAAVDLWGGGVVQEPTEKQPVAPIDMTADLSAPLLGLFGNDDQRPTPAEVDQHEEELKKHGKVYEFHRYDGAGHGFFYYDRPAYRAEQASDAWGKVWAFFAKHLA
jgi:carboxymethylenebutenolidase